MFCITHTCLFANTQLFCDRYALVTWLYTPGYILVSVSAFLTGSIYLMRVNSSSCGCGVVTLRSPRRCAADSTLSRAIRLGTDCRHVHEACKRTSYSCLPHTAEVVIHVWCVRGYISLLYHCRWSAVTPALCCSSS